MTTPMTTKIYRFLGSYGLAAALLVMLTVLTLFGTLEQQHSTLSDVQAEYFESPFVIHHWAGKYPIPWPGAMLLIPLLALNLLIGGLLRLRWQWSKLGIFVTHVGILVLLAGSLIEHGLSTKGNLALLEGESGSEFVSYDEVELGITEHLEDRTTRTYVVPQSLFEGATRGRTTRFTHESLPFDVVLSDFARNTRVSRVSPGEEGENVIDGALLSARPPISKEDEAKKRMNLPGLIATLVEKDDGTPSSESEAAHRGIVRVNTRPWTAEVQGRRFTLALGRRRWPLPFTIRLDEFVHEKHPGTGMDRRFSSYVTQTEDGTDRKVHITMNEPLRSQGYTLYQSSWGRDKSKYFSVFSVVANPSDRVPWISWTIILFGLLIHFVGKLVRYLSAQSRREAHARDVAAAGNA